MNRCLSIALVLTLSGCAGELDDSLSYEMRAPAADASVARNTEAGRAPVADAGAPRTPKAGSASEKPPTSSNANSNMNMTMNMSSNTNVDTKKDEDAGAGETDAPPPPAAMACDFRAIMQAKCGNANCHGAPGSVTGLDLTTAMLGARVEGRKGKGSCTDKLLVDVDNPRQSKLYLKVSGSSCGSQMPLGGMLSSDEQACVLNWIEKL
jgi:hypothetical protein